MDDFLLLGITLATFLLAKNFIGIRSFKGTEFQLGKMKKFCIWILAIVARQFEYIRSHKAVYL